MTTKIEKSVEVDVPIRDVYDQWTQFEDFPRFMQNVESVQQLDDTTTRWHARIAGAEREWDADIVEQEPDQRIAWRARGEIQHAGTVHFDPIDEQRTRVRLQMDVEPSDWAEKAADALGTYERTVEKDLDQFKSFIESRGMATGGWRGEVEDGRAT